MAVKKKKNNSSKAAAKKADVKSKVKVGKSKKVEPKEVVKAKESKEINKAKQTIDVIAGAIKSGFPETIKQVQEIAKKATNLVKEISQENIVGKKGYAAKGDAFLSIDFPMENDSIVGLHYAIRVGASKNGYVEISFNDGEWNPCRFGAGYWWFDWGYFKPGTYKISARLISVDNNKVVLVTERTCKVC
ncbi:MAG: hypothetical protein LBC07_06280 [Elusimicrobiota bacterium]|jgi:hypothetical protein|nr:hypothetical protein [Elusimicrobiota bacterium]